MCPLHLDKTREKLYRNASGNRDAASRLNFRCTYSNVRVRRSSVGPSELSVLSNEALRERGRLERVEKILSGDAFINFQQYCINKRTVSFYIFMLQFKPIWQVKLLKIYRQNIPQIVREAPNSEYSIKQSQTTSTYLNESIFALYDLSNPRARADLIFSDSENIKSCKF